MLRALLIVTAVLVAGQFVVRGFIEPLRQAFNRADSHYDFAPYYFAASDLRLGANPYRHQQLPSQQIAARYGLERPGGEMYAPIVVALYLPLAALDFPTAKAVWLAFNVILVVLSIPLLMRVAGLPFTSTTLAATVIAVMGFEPIVRDLAIGQANVPILVLLCLGSLALARGRSVAAGAALALAAIYKPIPAIVFAGLLLRREWRVIAGGAAVLVAAAGLSLALFGAATNASFLEGVAGVGRKWTFWFANQSLAGFFGRALINNEYGTSWTNVPWVARGLWLLADLTVIAMASRLTLRHPRVDPVWTAALWLVAGLLVSPRSWDHYFVWALVPLAVVAAQVWRKPRPAELAVLLLTYGLLAFPGMYWAGLARVQRGPLLLLTSSQTLGLLALLALMAHLERARAAAPGGPLR